MNHKLLSIILAIAFLLLGGYVIFDTYKQEPIAPQVQVAQKTVKNVEQKAPQINLPEGELEKDYLTSKFRVIGVFQKPAQPADVDDYKLVDKVQLVVATEKATETGDSAENDSGCGSLYTQPTCYFFIEPLYIAGAPSPKFVGQLKSQGAFDPKSLVFKSPDIVEFQTSDGDGPGGFTARWSLNLNTGQFKQLSKKEYGPEN